MGVSEIYGRSDYAIIGELIEPGTRVLDLGCGEGLLLAWLKENKNVNARGVELVGASVPDSGLEAPGLHGRAEVRAFAAERAKRVGPDQLAAPRTAR